MANFNDAKAMYFKRLEQFIPVVARVHGDHHPEFHDVKSVFANILSKVREDSNKLPNIDEEFTALRKITDNYTVPSDVCETYEAVYQMLEEVDKAYYNSK